MQSFRDARPLPEQRAAFDSRLSALAAAHDLLTEQAWHSASLHKIIRSALVGCGADEGRIELSGSKLVIPPKSAVSLSMALHELCTNAIKYGALSAPGGRIAVDWSVTSPQDEPRLELQWIESGGPRVEAPTRRGFGLRMLEQGLARELNGSGAIEFREDGVVCRIDAPLPSAQIGSNDGS